MGARSESVGFLVLFVGLTTLGLSGSGCGAAEENPQAGEQAAAIEFSWRPLLDDHDPGAMLSIWAGGPNAIWVVGGEPGHSLVLHFDGSTWEALGEIPSIAVLLQPLAASATSSRESSFETMVVSSFRNHQLSAALSPRLMPIKIAVTPGLPAPVMIVAATKMSEKKMMEIVMIASALATAR